ncbi:hypothetical protein SPI_02304 [Niveomyces insectorum RCEF 264]|uniref:Uncharacterized protein n=1 Tax=Niveomyces insectorum RCEF 264 TaxID=1081102 RepID=A0A167XX12_9HYPO|nr:hypothetical protein SPI_02304 [Niveomyces insectorum RCEF 264]
MTTLHGGTAPLAVLTTVFTPPCPTTWLVTTTKLPSQFPSFPAAGPVTCDPPAWASNLAGEGFQYYSPAICPDGFAVGPGCSIAATPRTAEGFPAVAADETVAWCVPSGQSCTSDTTDFRGGVWGVSRTATGAGAVVTVGPAMQIRWRDADLAILATHPLTPGLTLDGNPDAAPTPTQAAPSTAPPAPPPPPAAEAGTTTPPSPAKTLTTAASNTDAGNNGHTSPIGFLTLTAKTTLNGAPAGGTLTPASTIEVITKGTTLYSTIMAPATGSGGTGSANKPATVAGPGTRAFVATIVMGTMLSLATLGIAIFFFLSRRRQQRRRRQHRCQQAPQQQHHYRRYSIGDDLCTPVTDTQQHVLPRQGSPVIQYSAVGVGAWVRRKPKPARWQQGRWASWGSLFRLSKPPLLTGDGNMMRDHRRWRPRWPWYRHQQRGDEDQRARMTRSQSLSQSRSRTPLAELSAEDGGSSISRPALAAVAELEDSSVGTGPDHGDREDYYNDGASDVASLQKLKGRYSPSTFGGNDNNSSSSPRNSWMARLARFLRGGESRAQSRRTDRATPSDDDASFRGGSSGSSSQASTRWSHWSRWRDAPRTAASSAAGTYRDGDGTNTMSVVDEAQLEKGSWAAFARVHGGIRTLDLSASKGHTAREGGRHAATTAGGLTVPGISDSDSSGTASIPRLPSPAATVRSERSAGPFLAVLAANRQQQQQQQNHRFSRLSDGTFGRMDSFVSRADSSRTAGEAPGTLRSESGGEG